MPKRRDYLAIEIGQKYLKLAYLRILKGKERIVSVGAFVISDWTDQDISARITAFVRKHHIKKPEVINLIPSNHVISKNIEIPSVDQNEIKDIIELQAGRHTPYSKEEIIMDFTEIGVVHERYTKNTIGDCEKRRCNQKI